jgi:hypothetical protein
MSLSKSGVSSRLELEWPVVVVAMGGSFFFLELPRLFCSGKIHSQLNVIQLVQGIWISASHLTFLDRQTWHALDPLGRLYLMVNAFGFVALSSDFIFKEKYSTPVEKQNLVPGIYYLR